MKRSKKPKPSPFDHDGLELPAHVTTMRATANFVVKFEPGLNPGTISRVNGDVDTTPPSKVTDEQLRMMQSVLHKHNIQ